MKLARRDPLDANEWQAGLCGSFIVPGQVAIVGQHGRLRSVWLLHFAAAPSASLTIKRQGTPGHRLRAAGFLLVASRQFPGPAITWHEVTPVIGKLGISMNVAVCPAVNSLGPVPTSPAVPVVISVPALL